MQSVREIEGGDFIIAKNKNTASNTTLESRSSTTYQTTAYRSSSGAIVLNKIATTTTLHSLDAYGYDQGGQQPTPTLTMNTNGTLDKSTTKRKVTKKKIVVKKKLTTDYDRSILPGHQAGQQNVFTTKNAVLMERVMTASPIKQGRAAAKPMSQEQEFSERERRYEQKKKDLRE